MEDSRSVRWRTGGESDGGQEECQMEATLQAFFCEILSVVVAVQVVCMRMLWVRVNELQWQLVMDETRVITQYLQVNMMTRVCAGVLSSRVSAGNMFLIST